MNSDKWNEICFLLSENIREDINEGQFEFCIIQALQVLGWKQYSGDFDVRPSLHIGAINRITPDFVVKSPENQKLFVIEIKQPNIPLTSSFQKQLFSYMRQLKLEYGVLIGQTIQVFYDGPLNNQEDPVLLETIHFERDTEKGLNFVDLFSKETFDPETLEKFSLSSLKKLDRKNNLKKLQEKLISEEYTDTLSILIKENLLEEYDAELIDSVLENLEIKVLAKRNEENEKNFPYSTVTKRVIIDTTRDTSQPRKIFFSSDTLPINLNPPEEDRFKKHLLISKRAYITIYYMDGRNETKQWNVRTFNESSDLLGNIRSRPEFRQGEWQQRGIKKVYVSINDKV